MSKKSLLLGICVVACFGCSEKDSDNQACSESVCIDAKTLNVCVNGEYHVTPCDYGCSNGKCQEITAMCVQNETKCENGIQYLCSNNTWINRMVCENGCEGNVCSGANPSVECTNDDTKCENNVEWKCEEHHWNRIRDCENGCEGNVCREANPSVECTNDSTKCEFDVEWKCEEHQWNRVRDCENGCDEKACAEVLSNKCDCATGLHCSEDELAQCSCPSGKKYYNGVCVDEGLLNAKIGDKCVWNDFAYCGANGMMYYCDDYNVLQAEQCQGGCHISDFTSYNMPFGYYIFCGELSKQCTQKGQTIYQCVDDDQGVNAQMAVELCIPVVGGGYKEYWVGNVLDMEDTISLYEKYGADPDNPFCASNRCNAGKTACYDGCESDSDCTEGAARFCNTQTRECIECRNDSDCGGNICDDGICVKPCQTEADCSTGEVCMINECMVCHEGDLTTHLSDSNLQCVLGTLEIEKDYSLLTLEYPNLRYIQGQFISNRAKLNSISLPKLKSVSGVTVYYENMTSLEFPRLEVSTSSGAYRNINFYGNDNLERISFPKLKKAGQIVIDNNPHLTSILMPGLLNAPMGIDISVKAVENLNYTFDFSSLESAQDIELSFPGIVEFPKLGKIEFGLEIQFSNAEKLSFPELKECRSVQIDNNESLKSLSFPKLTSTNFYFTITNNPKLEELDLSSFNFYSNTNDKGWHIDNNSSLPCSTLCSLKDSYYNTTFSGDELYNYDEMFPGNKEDLTCPGGSYMDWSKCE